MSFWAEGEESELRSFAPLRMTLYALSPRRNGIIVLAPSFWTPRVATRDKSRYSPDRFRSPIQCRPSAPKNPDRHTQKIPSPDFHTRLCHLSKVRIFSASWDFNVWCELHQVIASDAEAPLMVRAEWWMVSGNSTLLSWTTHHSTTHFPLCCPCQ
jgi:hypothetical protein